MRTLYEIIESAKDGQMPTHEECYWAMLAFCAMDAFDSQALTKLAEDPERCKGLFGAKFMAEESFKRNKATLDKDPKEWVGWGNDPANPEYQKFRNWGKELVKKFSGKEE